MTNVGQDTHYDAEAGAWVITGKASAMSVGPSVACRESVFFAISSMLPWLLHILITTWLTGCQSIVTGKI